ncbi:MAG: helix-hairpin-helix domain-containing protein [Chitinophagales bacterium]|nr:helix-hairpin-helix domain-containing protein [Chitinophagales bacterium]
MKQYPFWKVWYFTREQRKGITLIIILILILIFFKGPVTNYTQKSKEKKLAIQNQKVWAQLKSQIDSSKAIAIQQQLELKENKKKNFTPTEDNFSREKTNQPIKNALVKFDINKASQQDLMQLRGIGSVLSERIIKYRIKLGGFYSIEQLKEVYGITDSTFLVIKKQLNISSTHLEKLNVNQASIEQLQEHPYISKTLSKQIIGYRQKVKPFASLEEIKKLYAMNDSIYNKLINYLIID